MRTLICLAHLLCSPVGAILISIPEILLRLLLPSYRQPVSGSFVLAIVFLAIGLGSILDWKCLLPLVVIGIGVYLLFTGLFRRRE